MSLPENSRPSELNLSNQCAQVVPLNATSCESEQPSTPEHPPPSPTTAMFGIQQKINLSPKVQLVTVLMCVFTVSCLLLSLNHSKAKDTVAYSINGT